MYKQKLVNVINSRKSYKPVIKEKLLAQVSRLAEDLTEPQFKTVLKSLPKVYKALAKLDSWKYQQLKKVVKLERHTNAPELNKLHFNNGSIKPVPQMTDIDNALTYLYYNQKT